MKETTKVGPPKKSTIENYQSNLRNIFMHFRKYILITQ